MPALLSLSNGDVTLVDDDLPAHIRDLPWGFDGRYVACKAHGRKLYLHRLVASHYHDLQPHQHVHHERGRLDNRAESLKVTTHADHARLHRLLAPPKGRYKGVRLYLKAQRYQAYIRDHNGRQENLGFFADPESAALAYNAAVQARFPGWPVYLNQIGA